MSYKNLLEETLHVMRNEGLQEEDIIFIGILYSGKSCTWDEFKQLANREYDAGYGGAEVLSDLVIAFQGGEIMQRGEYDGSEWWEVQRPFKMPERLTKLSSVFKD